jgi:hypothetical protein
MLFGMRVHGRAQSSPPHSSKSTGPMTGDLATMQRPSMVHPHSNHSQTRKDHLKRRKIEEIESN